MMTFPYSMDLFPPGVDLFPHWTVILRWLQDYAQLWGLYDSTPEDWAKAKSPTDKQEAVKTNGHTNGHTEPDMKFTNTLAEEALRELPRRILCNREIYSATWTGTPTSGRWKVVSRPFPHVQGSTEDYEDNIDHVIDASGHLTHPAMTHWEGEEEWLKAKPGRSIMHSAYYRGPEQFRGKTVVVVGSGPSGLDGSLQIGKTAKKVSFPLRFALADRIDLILNNYSCTIL